MGSDEAAEDDYSYREQSSVLADSRLRRVLSILSDRSHPMTVRDLAVQLTTQQADTAPADVSENDHHRVRVDLHHRCLPKLEAVGLIERHPEGIIATESQPFEDEDLLLPDLRDAENLPREAVSALLVRPRRQDLVSVIASQRHRLTLEELATELVERDHTEWTAEQRESECTLHHIDLPRLTEVGLIEYDSTERTITRTHALMTLVNRMGLGTRSDGIGSN